MCIWIFRLIVINEICQILQYPTDFGNYNKLNFYWKNILKTLKTFARGKTNLNPWALACFENSPKFTPSCLSFLYPKQVSSLGRQVDLTFYTREHLLGMHWMLVKLKWGRSVECLELSHRKGISRLIFWREILKFS